MKWEHAHISQSTWMWSSCCPAVTYYSQKEYGYTHDPDLQWNGCWNMYHRRVLVLNPIPALEQASYVWSSHHKTLDHMLCSDVSVPSQWKAACIENNPEKSREYCKFQSQILAQKINISQFVIYEHLSYLKLKKKLCKQRKQRSDWVNTKSLLALPTFPKSILLCNIDLRKIVLSTKQLDKIIMHFLHICAWSNADNYDSAIK